MNAEQFYPIYLQSQSVTIDSRKVEPGSVFFAFSGDNFNAATLADKAVEMGAAAVIIEDKNYENTEKNIFFVPSTLIFLQELAKLHRSKLGIPIIALTGSNGKTTTKELISTVLAKKFKVQYTFGNLNNHIGVPLTLLSIRPGHEIAVVEMGANHQKEIEMLCEIAQPDFGYITNFGKAHLEGFGGFEGVIKGKSELYNYLIGNEKTILINNDDEIQVEKTAGYAHKITFGTAGARYIFGKANEGNFTGISFKDKTAVSKLTGDYNFTNLCAAAALGLYFDIDFLEIKSAVEAYTPSNMRSQVVEKAGRTLVLDTYNANPSSMAASLENFGKFSGTKAVILGDMLELGKESPYEHKQILEKAQSLGFDIIITVGKNFAAVKGNLSFADTFGLAEYLKKEKIIAKNILLKGSRGIALEKILDLL